MAAAHYAAPYCGGVITGVGKGARSGKGEAAGPGRGESGMRNNKIMLWPSWGKSGTDCYCSSRWDERYQIYDLYWTPRPINAWWLSKPYDWVFIQELPWDKNYEDFVWAELINVTKDELKQQRFRQKMQFLRKRGRERAAWARSSGDHS